MRTLCLFVVMAVGSANAGVTLTFERTRQGKKDQFVVQLDGVKARTEVFGDKGEAIVVWDGEAKALTTLKPSDKTYTRMDEQTMTGMKDKLKTMKAQMDAQMAKLSPEQRAQMEQMMKGRGAAPGAPAAAKPEAKVTATGKKLKVGQFDCEVHERTVGELKQELCVAPWDKVSLTRDDMKPFTSMAEFMASMFEGFGGPGPAGAPSGHDDVMRQLDSYKGFPVQTTSADPAGGTSTMALKTVTRGAIDKTAFAVPAGYTEKKSPMQ